MAAYQCPQCKTNKTRFNIIQQISQSVKLNPQTGEVVQSYAANELEPFHLAYQGPSEKIQCAACGLIEDEIQFEKFAEKN